MQRREFLEDAVCGTTLSMASPLAGAVSPDSPATSSRSGTRDDVVDIGSSRQLFVDDYLLESSKDVRLVTTYWHWFDRSWMGIPHSTSYNLGPNANDIRLVVSRDGVNFSWVGDRRPFISLGMEGEWDSRMLHEMGYPLDQGNELWFYYTARNREHGPAPSNILDRAAEELEDGIGRVVLRKDGFVSADASYTGGELRTKRLSFSGEHLVLNADTSGGGVIRVEIQNPDGTPVAGYALEDCHPINGNSLALPVVWKEHEAVAALAGRPVRLRFVMADCKLYAFQFQG